MNKELCDLCHDMYVPIDMQRVPTHYIDDMGDQIEVEIEAFKNYYYICMSCLNNVKNNNNMRTEKYRERLINNG